LGVGAPKFSCLFAQPDIFLLLPSRTLVISLFAPNDSVSGKEETGSMAVHWSRAKTAVPWTGIMVALGLGLRLYHYLRNPSVWHDEAALVLNVLNKSYTELLGPLTFSEAAPPLFLWVEKAVTLLLGDSTYALRLVPFLASCAAFGLMVPIARHLLHRQAVPWALLLAACSDRVLWHTCEAKPYIVEVLAATVVVALFCFLSSRSLRRQLAIYTLLAPVLIFLAYPGCFLCGGLLVALLPAVWRQRQLQVWLGYAVLVVVVFGAFALLVAGPAHAQRCPDLDQCWETSFPPWDRPASVPVWTLLATLEVFRYCCDPVGQVLIVVAMIGVGNLWRQGRRAGLALLVTPIGLALLASFLRAYPYGGARVLAYATPAVILLIAAGVVPVFRWLTELAQRGGDESEHGSLPRAARLRRLARLGVLGLTLLLLAPLGRAVQRVVFPWPRAECARAAAYVLTHRRPDEAVAGNHWEYAYYFRHLGSSFTLLEGRPHILPNQLWLVTTAGTLADRLKVAHELPPGDWRTLEQHEFPRTTVFHLSRQADTVQERVSSDRDLREPQ
jgi:hypothetical protein